MVVMSFDIDNSHVLYGLGVVLGVFTVLYFGLEVILSLSPATKSFLLLAGSAGFFILADYLKTDIIETVLYILSGTTYLVFTGYTLLRFELGSELTFLFLAASSALFIFLGYRVSEKGLGVDRERYKQLLTGLAAISAVLLVFDVLGAQPEHNLQLDEQVELSAGEEAVIGTYTVGNNFLLPRDANPRRYSSCIFNDGERVRRTYSSIDWPDREPGMLYSGDSVQGNITASIHEVSVEHENETVNVSGTYSIGLQNSCPQTAEGNQVVVVEERD